jgi:hypothetical protein
MELDFCNKHVTQTVLQMYVDYGINILVTFDHICSKHEF